MTQALRAFHNDPAVQTEYMNRIEAHSAADQIIQGSYWNEEDHRGCAVGCTIHGSDHTAYERELGIPTAIAYLEDRIFECLPIAPAKEWPRSFLASIPLGADLSNVIPQFMAWLMDDPKFGLATTAEDPEIKELAAEVGRRYRAGETTGPEAEALAERLRAARAAQDARAARAAQDARAAWAAQAARAAWAAWAARAAWAAQAARAAWAAWAARAAWAAQAARAARDAWDAQDAWDARQEFVEASASELLRLLADAPVPTEVA